MFDKTKLSCIVGSVEKEHPRIFAYYSNDDITVPGYFEPASDFRQGDKIIQVTLEIAADSITRTEKSYALDFIGDEWKVFAMPIKASDVSFDSTGSETLTATNIQDALVQADGAISGLQNSVSILKTAVALAPNVGETKEFLLDELEPLVADGRPANKELGATVYGPNGQIGIITEVKDASVVITTIPAGGAFPGISDETAGKYLTNENGVVKWSEKNPLTNNIQANETGLAINHRSTLGKGAMAIGGENYPYTSMKATASGNTSMAIGPAYDKGPIASGTYSVALGPQTTASGDLSIALGVQATADGKASIAIGDAALTKGKEYTIVIGNIGTVMPEDRSFYIGFGTTGSGETYKSLGYKMLDADGHIPDERLPQLGDINQALATILGTEA